MKIGTLDKKRTIHMRHAINFLIFSLTGCNNYNNTSQEDKNHLEIPIYFFYLIAVSIKSYLCSK